MWKKAVGQIEEGVLEKYKVDVRKGETCKGRGEPSEDGPESEDISTSKMEWRLLGENLLEVQGKPFAAKARHAGEPNGKGGDEAAAKDEDHGRYDKKDQGKRQNGRKHQLVGL